MSLCGRQGGLEKISRRWACKGHEGWSGTCRRGQQRLVGWELLGGVWSELASVFDNSGLVDLTVINICSGRRLGQKTNESFHRHRTASQNPSLNHLYDCPDS